MTRNTEAHFSELPNVDIQRSIFDLSHGHMTTFDAGELIPIFSQEVLAGDTWEVSTSMVIRAQTMLTPTFSNMNADLYFYFVPFRLMWEHFPEFFGENRQSAWVQQVEYQMPAISSPPGGYQTGTIADHLSWPVNVEWSATDPLAPSALPLRGIALVCDQWFRDENLTDPLNIPLGDSNQTGSNGTNYINDVVNGGMPFKVAKYHDYFTSCLPSAMKAAQPVSFGTNPVVTTSNFPVFAGANLNYSVDANGNLVTGQTMYPMVGHGNATDVVNIYNHGSYDAYYQTETLTDGKVSSFKVDTDNSHNKFSPINLYADPTNLISVSGVSFTINELRLAFQLQRFYEKMARGGSRLIETLKMHFGVTSPDARIQRTEYLGGKRVPLTVHEITNTAQTQADFLGDVGAKLATSDVDGSFIKSFVEPGYIFGFVCVRYPHQYSQGLEKQYMRKKWQQFYWPTFANIGEQPVYDAEIYADSTTIANDTVFGYQEAYADYRFAVDKITGELRPGIQNTLASWHIGDYYTQKPTLSDSWIREDKTNVDRVLAVTSQVSNQFFADFWFDVKATRPMPVYSIPGLIDHN